MIEMPIMTSTNTFKRILSCRSNARSLCMSLIAVFLLVGFLHNSSSLSWTMEDDGDFASKYQRLLAPKPGASRQLINEVKQEMLNREPPIGRTETTTVLLGIFSTNSEKEMRRRGLIRSTYLRDGGEKICSLGEYRDQIEASLAENVMVTCQIPYVFVIGGGDPDTRPTEHNDKAPLLVRPEDAEYDAIYLNIKENVDRGKAVSYFKYASSIAEKYRIDYIAKTDSDTYINLPLLLNFMETELPPKPFNRRMYGGHSMFNFDRNSIYASGAFSFLSSDLANYISNILTPMERKKFTAGGKVTAFQPFEDVDIGTFVFSHPRPIKFINLAPYQFWVRGVKTRGGWMDWWMDRKGSFPLTEGEKPFSYHCPNWGFSNK